MIQAACTACRPVTDLDLYPEAWEPWHGSHFDRLGLLTHRVGDLNFSQVASAFVVAMGPLLLERERELAHVVELADGLAVGESGLVVVEGPAGAGKSAMLDALAAAARDRGLTVLRAVGLELEHDYPFGVVRQLFEPAVDGLDQQARRELFRGTAALAESLLAPGQAESSRGLIDPGFALAHSLYWVLVSLTDRAPVAVVVDDLQWSDRTSVQFLAFVLRRSLGLPLLVAVARRDGPIGEQAEADVVGGAPVVIRPAPLSGDAIAKVLGDAVGHEVDHNVVIEAERLTAGNPLFVRELAEALRVTGGVDTGDPFEQAAPAAVGRRVQIALGRLDPGVRRLATSTAILGDEVPLRRAAALAAAGQEDASLAADALARADIFLVGEPLRFRHPLVREAVLEGIAARERALLHARAARLLIADGSPPEIAAVHLLASDPAGDAETVATLRAAAQSAVTESAPELAIRALRRALREPPTPTERAGLLKELAMAEALVGDPEAFGHFEEAFAQTTGLNRDSSSFGGDFGGLRGRVVDVIGAGPWPAIVAR